MSNSSRFFGMVTTLGVVGMSLLFMFAMAESAHNGHDPAPVFGIIVAGVFLSLLVKGPVGHAIGKMLEGSSSTHDDSQLRDRIDQLEGQLTDFTLDQQRIMELEERLDFAERLLSQRDRQALQNGDR
jgi:hypothetical protein